MTSLPFLSRYFLVALLVAALSLSFIALYTFLGGASLEPDVGESEGVVGNVVGEGYLQSSIEPLPQLSPANGYLARVMLDSPLEVEQALLRAQELYERGDVSEGDNPLALVLHGPEVQIFLKDNYQQYKPIVDLAARLSAFNILDVKVCRTRLAKLEQQEHALLPFVSTVSFGPAEVERLLVEEEYIYF